MKKLKTFLKRIILSLAAAALILSFGDYAVYADSSSEPPEETLESLPGDSYDNQLRSLSVQLAATTSYTADDIYNLLNQCTVLYLNQLCLRVFDPGTTNAINTQGTSINSYLQSIQSFISSWYNNYLVYYDGQTNYSSVQLLYNLSVALDQINSNTSGSFSTDPSLYDQVSDMLQNTIIGLISDNANHDPYLYLINQDTSNIKNQLSYNNFTVAQSTYNAYTQLLQVSSYLNSIVTNTNSIAQNTRNLVYDLGSNGAIAYNISTLNNDLNNVTWSNGQITVLGFSSSLSNSKNNIYDITSSTQLYGICAKVTLNPYNNGGVFRIQLPIYFNSYSTKMPSIKVYSTQGGNFELPIIYYFNSIDYYGYLYFYAPQAYFQSTVIIEFEDYMRISPSTQKTLVYIPPNNIDYYTVVNYINDNNRILLDNNNNSIFSDFKDLYASDDLIAAKENQQSYEDQALSNFTGSGSAAASGSDLGNIKDVSSTLKNGLPNQGSVSNALNIFNNNSTLFSDLWAWFSQENYNNINNPSLRTRDSQIVNFLSQNEEDYYRYLYEGTDTR